jgi:predicted aldo/keto reductase-like oxidoreductase
MSDLEDQGPKGAGSIDRRGFLGASAGVAFAASIVPSGEARAQAAGQDTKSAVLPKRKLGRTGVDVSILNLGTWRSVGLDRILRFAWSNGIRYVDTAKSYGSEPAIAKWMQGMPEIRKDLFLVTKDHPANSPREMIKKLDERLKALQTDYVDLIFIHAVGDHNIATEIKWPESREFKATAEAIRKSGKAKFVGFSTHHLRRPEILQAAVRGGFVDAIMLQNNPWIVEEEPFKDINRALDACHKAGIGLISMKQLAGNYNVDFVSERLPELKEKGLKPYQGLLHAIWTDERISSCCVSMRNTDQVRDNAEAARKFKPLTTAEMRRMRDVFLAAGPTLCAGCDGSCSHAAGTTAELGNLTRFLTYHEHHGYRSEARRLYSEMTDAARNWAGADLEAARAVCPSKLDFAKLLPRADELLG